MAGHKTPSGVELLSPVVAPVGYVYIADSVDRNPPGQVQFPRTFPPGAPLPQKAAIFGIALNSVVATVDDLEVLIGIEGDAGRSVELPFAAPFHPPLAEEAPPLVEDGNP